VATAAAPPASDVLRAARWRCPRCGSHRVDEQHTDALTVRFIELMCEACALYAGFDAGSPDEAAWR
jgi:uncharacterized protein (DUF983 family)